MFQGLFATSLLICITLALFKAYPVVMTIAAATALYWMFTCDGDGSDTTS